MYGPRHRAGSEPSKCKANPLSNVQDFFPALPKPSPSRFETQTNGLESEMFQTSSPQSELSRVPNPMEMIVNLVKWCDPEI